MIELDCRCFVVLTIHALGLYKLIPQGNQLFLDIRLVRYLNVIGVLIVNVLLVLCSWLDKPGHFIIDDVEEIDIRVNISLHYLNGLT